jgi:hypothetical protein
MFFTAFTKALHLLLSWARTIQFTPPLIYTKSIIRAYNIILKLTYRSLLENANRVQIVEDVTLWRSPMNPLMDILPPRKTSNFLTEREAVHFPRRILDSVMEKLFCLVFWKSWFQLSARRTTIPVQFRDMPQMKSTPRDAMYFHICQTSWPLSEMLTMTAMICLVFCDIASASR